MIAKVALLFLVVVGVSQAAVLLNSGLVGPGILNSGILAPGLASPLLSAPIATTSSVVATPGAITTDRRVIGTTGLIAGAPLGLSNGIITSGLIGTPIGLSSGIVSPIGLRSGGILAGPGLILK